MNGAVMREIPGPDRLVSSNDRWIEGRDLLVSVKELGAITTRRRYESGDLIYLGEEPGDGVYIVTGGVMKVAEPHSAGREVTIGILGEGDFFGRFVVKEDGFSAASRSYAEAVTRCEIEKIPRVFVERFMRSRPESALVLAKMLESRLIQHEALARCVLPRKTTERLTRLLPFLANKFGEETAGGEQKISVRLTHQDLANIVAATRESVTAALVGLRRRAVIEVIDGHIVLVDREGLDDAPGL